ncbi:MULTISPECIES: endonuclease domain-containing protein [unclassified Luteococcus]|uniref:endonuclease domain-containing protein n=1 Tax=unclassified Luteococcus TaxID=2639923 RepID=UPI00313E1982
MTSEAERLLDAVGVLRRKDHPGLATALDYLVKLGRAVTLLPGIVVPAAKKDDLATQLAAVGLWDPDAVITGLAAARLGFWEKAKVSTITVLTRRRLPDRGNFRFSRASIDVDDVVEKDGTRFSSPTWTAVWLARSDHGEATDEALRATKTTPEHLTEMMDTFKWRVGNRERRFIVVNSRERPWSQMERRGHEALRDAGVTGWKGNHVFTLGGRTWPGDIVFEHLRLVIELDGFEFHSSPETFQADHEKDALLLAEGWITVRLSWAQVKDPARFVELVLAAMQIAARAMA